MSLLAALPLRFPVNKDRDVSTFNSLVADAPTMGDVWNNFYHTDNPLLQYNMDYLNKLIAKNNLVMPNLPHYDYALAAMCCYAHTSTPMQIEIASQDYKDLFLQALLTVYFKGMISVGPIMQDLITKHGGMPTRIEVYDSINVEIASEIGSLITPKFKEGDRDKLEDIFVTLDMDDTYIEDGVFLMKHKLQQRQDIKSTLYH